MTSVRVLRWTAAGALIAALAFPAAAAADDLIVIPVSGFARGAEGDVLSIATVAVPADVVGATCQITGSTVNQISVHEGNDLLIVTGGQTFVVPNFEDAGFIMHEAGETAAIGSSIDVRIRFGPDGVSSGGFRVSIDCETTVDETVPPTSTTEPVVSEPSTTAPSTTAPSTTAPSTTTPAITEPTSTITPPSTDVDANAPTTAPATTAPDTSAPEEPPAGPTTDAPTTDAPSTTAPAPSTTPSTDDVPPAGPEAGGDDVSGSLPVTGSSTSLIVGIGALLMGAGLVFQRFATRSS